MTTPHEPPRVSLSHYLVMVPHHWGKGPTPAMVRANLREAGGEPEQADPGEGVLLRVHPDSTVDDINGDAISPKGLTPYLIAAPK